MYWYLEKMSVTVFRRNLIVSPSTMKPFKMVTRLQVSKLEKYLCIFICLWLSLFSGNINFPQVKRNLICSITNLEYELPHELLNDLRLRILENLEIFENLKLGWRHSLVHRLSSKNQFLVIAVKNTQT